MKFIPGQRVEVIKVGKDSLHPEHKGQRGVVMTATPFGYKVLLDTWDEEAIFFEQELEAVVGQGSGKESFDVSGRRDY